MNVYLTGDTHGRFERIACFCRDNHTTRGDCVIVHVPHRAQPSYLVDNISLSFEEYLPEPLKLGFTSSPQRRHLQAPPRA